MKPFLALKSFRTTNGTITEISVLFKLLNAPFYGPLLYNESPNLPFGKTSQLHDEGMPFQQKPTTFFEKDTKSGSYNSIQMLIRVCPSFLSLISFWAIYY